MALLPDYPTVGQVRDLLFSAMVSADGRKSTTNPSFTKKEMWNMYMGILINSKDDSQPFIEHPGAASIAAKNLNREFGGVG